MTIGSRTGKDLIDASRPFAREDVSRSWFHVATTFAALAAAITIATRATWLPLRIVASIAEALVFVRAFILYHDHMHGALLRESKLAKALFHVQGVLMLNPPRVWADTHNFHHANTARLAAPATGTFVLWTVDRWRKATWLQKLAYRAERNPITIFFAHITVFFMGMCAIPFVQNPKRYLSCAIAVVSHVALGAAVWTLCGPSTFVLTFAVPFFLSCMIGAYLFYAQHNAPGITVRDDDEWTHAEGAVEGSTFMKTGPLMQWFSGNIGFHHIHHLNARIPFYRLPEAMAAIPELQNPVVTSLSPKAILDALRVDLWDPRRGRMVTYAEAAEEVPATATGTLEAA
jgi:omega-6 fatty acid desaturase (delta-12 desaturase)